MSLEIIHPVLPRHIFELGRDLDAIDAFFVEKRDFNHARIEDYRNAKKASDAAQDSSYKVIRGMLVPDQQVISPEFLERDRVTEIAELLNKDCPAFDEAQRVASGRGKFILWLLERGECGYCDMWIAHPGLQSQADHIVPFANGGETEQSNMVCACRYCNVAKGIMPALDFIERLDEPDGITWRDQEFRSQEEYFKNRREERAWFGY